MTNPATPERPDAGRIATTERPAPGGPPAHTHVRPAPGAHQGEAPAHRWWILVTACLAQLMVVLDATVVNIALPTAQADLGFSDDSRQWIVTGYALAFGALLLVGGRIGDLIGRKLAFLIGLVGFAGASALGGAASGLEMLVAARVGQGVFAALLAPAALSLLTTTFTDPHERGRAFATYGALSGAGGAIGLILGGALTEYTSWRWCLFINVPIAVVAVALGLMLLGRNRPDREVTIDLPGALLSVAGLVCLVYGHSKAETDGWSAGVTLGFIAAGVLLVAIFAVVETRVGDPLLPLSVLLDRNRGGAFVSLLLVGGGMFGVFLFLTYYLSVVQGFDPLPTGLAFLPMIAGIAVSSQFATRVVERVGAKLPIGIGFLVGAAGMWSLTLLDVDSSYAAHVVPSIAVLGLGLGFVLPPSISAATDGVDAHHAGVASAAVNTFQQIGGSIGTAILSASAASAAEDYLASHDASNPMTQIAAALESYQAAFWWSAGLLALGGLWALIVLRHGAITRDPDAPIVVAH